MVAWSTNTFETGAYAEFDRNFHNFYLIISEDASKNKKILKNVTIPLRPNYGHDRANPIRLDFDGTLFKTGPPK